MPARQRWMDWHMRIIQRNVLESIGASVLPLRVYVVEKTKSEKKDKKKGEVLKVSITLALKKQY